MAITALWPHFLQDERAYLGLNSSQWLLVFITLVTLYIHAFRNHVKKNAAVPIMGVSAGSTIVDARVKFRTEAQSMLLEGYTKRKGKPFYIPSPLGERLMIPPKYVDELRNAPMDEVDFVGTFFEMMEGKYTTMGSRSTLHPRVARLQLNQHMESILEPVYDEIVSTFEEEIPLTDDWIPMAMSSKILTIIARASSRMFGGKSLASNQDWLHASLNFATDGFMGAQKIKATPRIFRPIRARLLPEVRRIHKHYDTTRKAVREMFAEREGVGGKEKPNDFLQWMHDDLTPEEKKQGPNFLADILLKVSFAALHTSAATPMQLIYDLCSYPEYISPLREEIQEIRSEHAVMDRAALRKMTKLDSFMKESLRFNPLLLITFERIVHRELVLSDGFRIPAGTHIGAPSQAIAMDPDLYENPEVFDGFRHEKLRAKAENDASAAGRTFWASANLDNMAFGYGRHACPGRFFAGNEVKMIMVYFLTNYDFKYQDTQKGRPENFRAETQLIPNHETEILVRRKKT